MKTSANDLAQAGVAASPARAELGMSTTMPATGAQDALSVIKHIERALLDAGEKEQAVLYYRLGCAALAVGSVRTQALVAFTRMHEIAVRMQDKRLEALANNGLSSVHDTIGLRNESLCEALEAERLAIEVGDQRLLAMALNNQAQFYKETGQNPQAGALFQRVQEIGYALNDERLVMAGYIGLGRTTPMADAEKAISYYQQAMVAAEAIDDAAAISLCYNNLADWKIYMGLYEEAITLREKSERISRHSGDKEGIGRALIGIAKAHTLLGHYDQAWQFLNTGLPMVLSAADFEGELHSYLNLAHLYVCRGDIGRACDYYQRTLDKSLAAPDAACALFAQKALEQLAEGQVPKPGVLPPQPVTPQAIKEDSSLKMIYGTGDQKWTGMGWIWLN